MKQRHKVLGLLGILSVLTFVDRLAIAVAGPTIQKELAIGPQMWGWVLSVYVLANGVFEVPSGATGDRYGQRGELTRIVTWWSAFTALTGWCRTFWQMAAVRFLFGVGAAGAYPNTAGVIARWFPKSEQARSQGFIWASSRLGGAIAPLTILPLERWLGWRAVFWILGAVGCAWAAVWYGFFRNMPGEDGSVTQAELAEIGAGEQRDHGAAWGRVFRSRDLWLVAGGYGCYGCVSWFYYTWFPIWLMHSAGFSLNGIFLTALPFAVGFAANLAGGVVADRLSARWGAQRALRSIPAVCLLASAAILAMMASIHGKIAVVALSSIGFGVMDLMLPSAWALCVTIGGSMSGTATGVMNTAGQAGGFLCTVMFGWLVGLTGSYNAPVWMMAGMVALSALLFAQADCTRRVDRGAHDN